MEAGCDDFATKPVDFAGLIALIEKHVPGNVGMVSARQG
jgi:DNA-binding response OmpR family regulator